MKKRRVFVVGITLILIGLFATSSSWAMSTTDGFTYGKKLVLKGKSYCNTQLIPSVRSCYDGDHVGFRLTEGAHTGEIVAGSTYGKRLVRYKYKGLNMPMIYVAYMKYEGQRINVQVNGAGDYYCRGKIGFNWEAKKDKVNEGFPRWYHQTATSPFVHVLVKPRKTNSSPIITDVYTKVNGNRYRGSIYNNTTGIRYAVNVKDADGDLISLKSSGIRVNGSDRYGSLTYRKFKAIFGEEKSRGEYNRPTRGNWSMTWYASDGKKSTSKSYSQLVKNRAPVVVSQCSYPTKVKKGDNITFRASALDSDGDRINALRFYVLDSRGNRVFPFVSNYRTIVSDFRSGSQGNLELNTNEMNLKKGRYTAYFYAVDGYDGKTRSSEKSCSFYIDEEEEKDGNIVDMYTTINDIKTSTPLYNNTENIKFAAVFRGNCENIRSKNITVDNQVRFGEITYKNVNSTYGIVKTRGYYQRPKRGKWKISWSMTNDKERISKYYQREVRNRRPYILESKAIPNQVEKGEIVQFKVRPFDADGDLIKNLKIRIEDYYGREIEPNIIGGRNITNGNEADIVYGTSQLAIGNYIAYISGCDDYDGSYGTEKAVYFQVTGKDKKPIPIPIPDKPTGGDEDDDLDDYGGMLAMVQHTSKWDAHRREFNKYYKKNDMNRDLTYSEYVSNGEPRGRGKNVFWSGEKFVLNANPSSRARSVSVSIVNTPYRANLKKANGSWKGVISSESMKRLWGQSQPELLRFKFVASGKKYYEEKIVYIIMDSTISYWDLHREERK